MYRVPHIWIPTTFFLLLLTLLYFGHLGFLQSYLKLEPLAETFLIEQYCINMITGFLAILGGQLPWYLKYKQA